MDLHANDMNDDVGLVNITFKMKIRKQDSPQTILD